MAGASYSAHVQWVAAVKTHPSKGDRSWIGGAGPWRDEMLVGAWLRMIMAVWWTAMMGLDIAEKLESAGRM